MSRGRLVRLSPRNDEGGFTLIELVIVLVILPLVFGGISVVIITSLQDQQGLASELASSSGAQSTAAFFVQDVQSANTISTSGSVPCGPSGATQILGLEWTPPGGTATAVSYGYLRVNGGTPTLSLVRSLCTGGASERDTYVARELDPSTPPTASICLAAGGCQPNPSGPFSSGVDSVHLVAKSAQNGATFSLNATPRQWASSSAGGVPVPSLLLLGPGTGVLSDSDHQDTNVTGPVVVNSSADGSISMTGHGDFDVVPPNRIYVSDPNPTNAVSASGKGQVNPSPIFGPAMADPYANVNSPGQPAAASPCAFDMATDTDTCTPGYYASVPTLMPGASVVFNSGVYYFAAGIDLSVSDDVSEAPTSGGSATGVFFYVAGGDISFPQGGNVNLSPLAQASLQNVAHQDMLIWQAGPGTVNLSGSDGTYSGIVYSPHGDINLSGSKRVDVLGTASNTLHISQSVHVSIGP